jgi:protocatechuate 3,4-dioxygenase beta subunit
MRHYFNMNAYKGITIFFAVIILTVVPLDTNPSVNQLSLGQGPDLPYSPPSPPPFSELSPQQIASSTNKTCTLTPSLIEIEGTPQQIEGPYFVDDVPNRSDIRSEPSNGSIQDGIPLHVILHVYGVTYNNTSGENNCTPLSGAKVDIWHANSQGVYSGVELAGTGGLTYLRGYQITDENGIVMFDTIYPGWYENRAIHIHVKVRDFEGPEKTLEWTSQLYLNNSINEQVHSQQPYSSHGPVPITNEEDFIYRGPSTDGLVKNNTGNHLMLNLTPLDLGYNGTFAIGLNASELNNNTD